MGRRKFVLAALCALIVIAVGWALVRTADPETTTAGARACSLATLPPQALDTVRKIRANGPFPFPPNDGVVFDNREGHLPGQLRGYYHEYTVITPGAPGRSRRRIVTGGSPLTNPLQYFYTDDHYDSFCLITDAGR